MKVKRIDSRGLEFIKFDLSYARRLGRVIKNNEHTVIVEFVTGCNDRVRIKRHKRKHNVRTAVPVSATIYTQGSQDVMWESGGTYVGIME